MKTSESFIKKILPFLYGMNRILYKNVPKQPFTTSHQKQLNERVP